MRHTIRASAVALALAVPLAGAADTALSLRTGWAIPMGDAVSGVGLNEWWDGFVPVQLDLDFGVSERARLGVYAQYGFASAVCNQQIDCSGRSIRAGVQAIWALGEGSFAPWLGAGAGFEQMRYEQTTPNYYVPGGADITQGFDLNGWELNLQGGAAWTLSKRVKLGPYLLLAAGRYEGGDISAYADKSIHAWAHVGVRCSFGL